MAEFTLILGIIKGLIDLYAGLPDDVKAKQAEEFQGTLDWWRHLLGLYVPADKGVMPPVVIKSVSVAK
jgi:hypothetical protein